jgi:hypothetical protein
MTMDCTETPFICYSQVNIIGIELQGVPWFVAMLLLAFALQIAANFIWLQNSQVSRVLLQYKKGEPRRAELICQSVGWTALSTSIGILRVIFIIGNNLWLYIVILAGDVVGTAAASYVQSKDEDNTLDVIIKQLEDPRLLIKKKKIVQLLMLENKATDKRKKLFL